MRSFSRLGGIGVLGLFFLLQAGSVEAAHSCIDDGYYPPNTLSISTAPAVAGSMTESEFNGVIDRIEAFYRPIVASRGGNLTIQRNWQDGTVNAYADRSGNSWIVKMYGGLARHPAITLDGFTLVACHEMGHHLGGAPKFPGQWASNEGQSDYFSTLKCLRKIWASDNNVELVKTSKVPAEVTQNCEKSFGDANSIALCVRTAMAGLSSATLMQQLSNAPAISFSTPDSRVVSQTSDMHPAAQCRLDTYYGGSICQVAASEELSDTNAAVGTCATETGATRGYRPFCWYKPTGGTNPNPTPNPNPTWTPSPNPNPNPGGIARPPLGPGGETTVVTNPSARVVFQYDTSDFQGAAGIWFEVSAPNREFSDPNGVTPDPSRTIGAALRGARGKFYLVPGNSLPGWGTYSIRLLPLDSTGKKALGKFSNPARLILQRRK
jgi:hypothetical protein